MTPQTPQAETNDRHSRKRIRNPWLWVPSLYFAEGIPYVIVMTVSVIMYKRLGISNTEIALYTSWLYLPWVIKPLWSPVVDLLRTKRFWIIAMQLVIGAGLAGVALTLPAPNFFKYTLAFLWLLAFSSATHDIAADGFYMLGLDRHQQAWFVGVRSTFYRLAMITGQGLLVILAGYIESVTGLPTVKVPVTVAPGVEQTRLVHPDSLRMPRGGDPAIVIWPQKVQIPPQARAAAEVDSLVAFARKWNGENGGRAAVRAAKASNEPQPSWWHRRVAAPLERFLRQTFGEEKPVLAADRRVGNVGVIYLALSRPPEPGREITVTFGRERGDRSIRLVTGGRFVFDERNWNHPRLAVVQLDPKLKHATRAVFAARAGNIRLSWIITFLVLAGMFLLFFLYHRFILPYPAADSIRPMGNVRRLLAEFLQTFASFFRKPYIGRALAFLLLYRFAEAQLVKIASPFLLDTQEAGGLALTTGQVGFVYGTVGIISLTVAGLLGGFLAARNGLKHWLWWMVIAINLPDAVYIFLAHALPQNFLVVNLCVAIEQFGYGFGFTAYMLYMIYISEGEHKTAHFAISTGFMALGMMLPGMFSGWLQEIIGYRHFFVWIMLATIPGFIVSGLIPIDPNFGKKTEAAE